VVVVVSGDVAGDVAVCFVIHSHQALSAWLSNTDMCDV
jgi:proteasome lid subunit RPN8/RPN11